jgi:hypothetical protein
MPLRANQDQGIPLPTAPRLPLRSAAALAFACALTLSATEAVAACARPTRFSDLQPTFGLRIDFGRNLSTDFGTDPLRSEGNNVAHAAAPPQRWAWHSS